MGISGSDLGQYGSYSLWLCQHLFPTRFGFLHWIMLNLAAQSRQGNTPEKNGKQLSASAATIKA
jgi:phosphatidylethanolamine-binding protein (PEBP) family uncharacterized protein